MFAAFLGGWEIVLILAVMLMMGIGVAVAFGVIAFVVYRQQKKSTANVPAQQSTGH